MPHGKRSKKRSRRKKTFPPSEQPLIQEIEEQHEHSRPHLGQGDSKVTEVSCDTVKAIPLAVSQAHLLHGSLIKRQRNYLTQDGICLDTKLVPRKDQNVYKHQLPEKYAQGMNIRAATRADEETLLNVIESADLDQAIKLLDHLFSQDGLDRALISACRHGLKYLVHTLVRLGANVNVKDTQGNTPLLICAENSFVDIVHFLLKRKACVNALNSAGDSALILSIRASGSSEMVKVLLAQEGIDINHQNLDGYSALMKAMEVRDIDVIKILIDTSSKMKVRDIYPLGHGSNPWWKKSMQTISATGMTAEEMAEKYRLGTIYHILKRHVRERVSPLLEVIEKCDTESLNTLLDCHFVGKDDICKAFQQIFEKCDLKEVKTFANNEIVMIRRLLECGADITTRWYNHSSPLSIAVKTGDYNLVELLCQHLDEKQQSSSLYETQALKEAAKTGRCDLLELLLKYKADVNGYDYSGSPLDCALSHGHVVSANLLVQHGAKMNVKNALQSAVTHQVPEYINFILNYYKPEVVTYAKKDFRNFCNLLVDASKSGNLKIIECLLDAGVDVNPNVSRESPLENSKDGVVARFLITRGANVNHLTHGGDTPLLNILNNRNEYVSSNMEVVKVLLENGAYINATGMNGRRPIMIAASKEGSVAMLQILLDHGADVNDQDEEGNTALIIAVQIGCSQNVSFLLQFNKEKNHCLNVQNHKGLTALMYAADDRDHKIVEQLLAFNADVNIKDENGNTALLHSVENIYRSVETMTALIRAGSFVNCQNNDGFSPLMLAAIKPWKEAILILLDSGADVNAVSKKYTTKTALTFLSPGVHFGKDIKSCLQALLKSGASSSYANPGLLYKLISHGELDVIPELIRCGLGPADVKRESLFLTFSGIQGIPTVSPLCMALLVGNVSLARYFVGNLFLTSWDMTSLAGNQNLRTFLERMRYQNCLEFLDEMSSQPLSLFQHTFVTVLSAVGTSPGRENRVNLLPLPQVMKDKLLFKSEEVQLNIPKKDLDLSYLGITISDLLNVNGTYLDDSDNSNDYDYSNDDYIVYDSDYYCYSS